MTLALSDLAALLAGIPDPTGTHPDGIPVVYPGTPSAAFPTIVLAPDDDTLEATRLLRAAVDVTVMVARANQTADYQTLDGIYRTVLDRLYGSSFTLAGPFRFDVFDRPGDPPALARFVPVSYVTYTLCAPIPDPDPESE